MIAQSLQRSAAKDGRDRPWSMLDVAKLSIGWGDRAWSTRGQNPNNECDGERDADESKNRLKVDHAPNGPFSPG
jgi:hypothetical protein